MIERGVRLSVRDLLAVNSDVTMYIISSLSSMDEANRLFAIMDAHAIAVLDALPTYNYLALTITHNTSLFYLLFPSDVLHSYRWNRTPQALSLHHRQQKQIANSCSDKTQKDS